MVKRHINQIFQMLFCEIRQFVEQNNWNVCFRIHMPRRILALMKVSKEYQLNMIFRKNVWDFTFSGEIGWNQTLNLNIRRFRGKNRTLKCVWLIEISSTDEILHRCDAVDHHQMETPIGTTNKKYTRKENCLHFSSQSSDSLSFLWITLSS